MVSVAYRVGLPVKNKHLNIIRFGCHSTREAWLTVIREDKNRRIKIKDINSSLDTTNNKFINKHLSSFNKMLLFEGKSIVKDKKLAFSWA